MLIYFGYRTIFLLHSMEVFDVIEIGSSSDLDGDIPSNPLHRLRPHRYNAVTVKMNDGEGIEMSDNKPRTPLPALPPCNPVTKTPNIALPGEGYDTRFVWEVWAILDRANTASHTRHPWCSSVIKSTCSAQRGFWRAYGFARQVIRIDK